jgi:energy-coupling factor transporter ATP-binding protein EcfA2
VIWTASTDRSGARIGLVGVNGTGKTSVLRLLDGELQPTAGTISAAPPEDRLSERRWPNWIRRAGSRCHREPPPRNRVAGGREISADTLLRTSASPATS